MAFSIVKHFRDRMVTAVASPVQQQSQPQPQPQSQQPSQLVISPGTSISATTNAPDSMAVGINTGTMIKAPPGQPGPGGDALGPMTVKPAWQGVATASVSNITTGTYYVTVSSNRADKIKIDLAY
jgi:hypothetical protein